MERAAAREKAKQDKAAAKALESLRKQEERFQASKDKVAGGLGASCWAGLWRKALHVTTPRCAPLGAPLGCHTFQPSPCVLCTCRGAMPCVSWYW